MMIKLPAALLITLFTSQTMAGVLNLRSVDIGDSCQDAVSDETVRGLQASAEAQQMFETGTVLFTDTQVAGQITQVLYQCRGGYPGAIFGYSITVQTTDEPRAQTVYGAAKAAVIAKLGSPHLDSDKLGATDKKAFENVPGGPRALSSWEAANGYSVHVSLQKSSTSEQWTVVTSVKSLQTAAPPPPQ
jgi:hypothetical protein